MTRSRLLDLITLLLLACPAGPLLAQSVPQVINHEGLLLDDDGLPMEGMVSLRVALYDRSEDGNTLWFEEYQVQLIDGYYLLRLGEQNDLGGIFDGEDRYLGIAVNHQEELQPRQRLVSVPYAMLAENVLGDITPHSIRVGGEQVIDNEGNWVGPPVPGAADGVGYDTPEQVLVALRTVDGAGSQVDADLLDGLDGSEFVRGADQVRDLLATVDGSGSGVDADRLDGLDSTEFVRRADQVRDLLASVDGSGSGVDADLLDGLDSSEFVRGANQVRDLLASVDGSGSGVDADRLDGLDSSEFVRGADQVRDLLGTVDGSGSGVDADRLDGLDSSLFLRADQDTSTSGSLGVGGDLSVSGGLDLDGGLQLDGPLELDGMLTTRGIRVRSGSRVGLGVDAPQVELDVAGGIRASGGIQAGGGVRLGADNGECNAQKAGMLRWQGGKFEGCNGEQWVRLDNAKTDLIFSGILGYWKFEGDYQDVSGHGQHGSPGGSVRFEPSGIEGSAVRFDGRGGENATTSWVELPNINPRNGISVAVWIRSATSNRYNGVWQIVSKYSSWILGTECWDCRSMCFIIHSGGWRYGSCYSPADTTQWHHFVGTYDSGSGSKKLYADGVLRSETVPGGLLDNDGGPIDLGHRECCDHGNFNGWLDELQIYNRALSADEVAQLYDSTRP